MKKLLAHYIHTTKEFIKSLLIILPIAFVIRTYGYGLYQLPPSGSMETTLLNGERFFADKFTPIFRPIAHNEIITFNDPRYPYSDNSVIEWWQMYVYGPANWTKRAIGCPGDEIKGVIEDNKPIIYLKKKNETEFVKLDEPYVNKYPIVAYATKDSNPERPFGYKSIDLNKKLGNQPFYNFTLTHKEIQKGIQQATQYGAPPILNPQTPIQGDTFHIKLDNDHYWVMGDNRLGSCDSRTWGPLHKKLIHGRITYRILSIDSDSTWPFLDLMKHPIDFLIKQVRWNRCLQFVS
jgi:signal peptidase I